MARRIAILFCSLSLVILAQEAPAPKALPTGEAYRATGWDLSNTEFGASTAEGRLRPLDNREARELPQPSLASDGTRYTVLSVSSPGAAALRLHFTRFHLPPNARVFVYSLPESGSDPHILGPYTGPGPFQLGEFWTAPLAGSRVAVEIQWTGDLDELPFEIGEAGHFDSVPEPLQEAAPAEVDSPVRTAVYRGLRIPYRVVDGLAVAETDILLGRPDELTESTSSKGEVSRQSTGINSSSYRWANGIIPYTIDPGLPNQQRVLDAVAHWNTKLAGTIKLVPRTTEPYFITYYTGSGCSSYVGFNRMANQPIILADACSTGNAIHETGHAVGLWHEQTRNDRDGYVQIISANIDPNTLYNFTKTGSSGVDLGAYDYGSIMHYGAYSFSINGQPTIVTIPPGIPIGQRNALSSGDINGVLAMYPAVTPPATVSITIASNPSGLSVTVDGKAATTPASYSWTAGSTHTLAAANQTLSGTIYNFTSWSNGGAATQTITTPSSPTTYTAGFAAQQQPVAVTVGTSPSGMTVTVDGHAVIAPAAFNWLPGSTHTLGAANQASGGLSYNFSSWSNGGAASQTITTPSGAAGYTATFALQPVSVTVTSNATGLSATVDSAPATTPAAFSWMPGSSHSLAIYNQTLGGTKYVFTSWSNSGPQSQTVNVSPSVPSYTANFAKQYRLTASASPAAGGSITPSASSPDGFYAANYPLSLTAAAAAGYCFTGWTGSASSYNNTLSLSMVQPMTVTANFAAGTFSQSPASAVVANSGGTVTVKISSTCPWAFATTPAWAVASQTSGTGNATLTVNVSRNTGGARMFYLTASGVRTLIYQYGAGKK
jgi:hypothetical protein